MRSPQQRKRSALARLAPLLLDLRDVLVLVGLALLAAGVGMIYRPAAFILVGLVLMALGLYGVPRWGS
jgi:hypothetical protein